MSSCLTAVGEFPCQGADTSRHHGAPRPFRLSATHYFDERDRLTITRARQRGCSSTRPVFCPLGVERCAFDPKRVGRLIENARRSEDRARSSVIELARCNRLDHLLTLTAGAHLRSRGDALDAVSAFLASRRHGRWFAAHIGPYVAVAEPFSADGWHIHMGIDRPLSPPVLLRLKESWTRFLALECGVAAPSEDRVWRVNVARPRSYNSPMTLGAYLAKRIEAPSKGKKSYRCARDMARALKQSVVALLTAVGARSLVEAFGRPRRIVHSRSGAVLGWTTVGTGAREYLGSLELEEVEA